MNNTLIATISGVSTAFCWGTSDYLSAKSSKKLGPLEINFVVEVIASLMAAVLYIFWGAHVDSAGQLIRIAVSNMLLTAAYMIFVKALSSGAVGILVPLGNIYPLFTIIFSVLFLGSRFHALELLSMFTIVAGAMLMAYEKNTRQVPLHELHKDTALALLAAMTWGLGFFILNPIVSQVSWQTISIYGQAFALILAIVSLLAIKRKRAVTDVGQAFKSPMVLLVGLVGPIGTAALYFGSTKAGNVAIPAVLSSAGPVVATLWSIAVDHEKLGFIKRGGAALVMAGIVALNLT